MLLNFEVSWTSCSRIVFGSFINTSVLENILQMRNYTGKKAQFGCNDVIMLITDGAPNYFKQIFQLYNKNKSVRAFIFTTWLYKIIIT